MLYFAHICALALIFSCGMVRANPPLFKTYKDVIIIHGLLENAEGLKQLQGFIESAHPFTTVHLIDLFDGYESLQPMWKQVDGVRDKISAIFKWNTDGVHIIGYSQGGLVARGIIQTTDNHNIHSFISLSSPQNGQYGDTFFLDWLPHFVKSNVYEFFYTASGQRWSVANYWKDPHEIPYYQQYSAFLAHLNNETGSYPSRFRDSWRINFEKLKKVVLVGGPDDQVITPWQSAQFGFYDEQENVVLIKDQEMYRKNTFGLATLDRRDDLVLCTVGGIEHLAWHKSQLVFDKCIGPYLN